MHTLDSLLAKLQELKAAGTAGDTPVALASVDNNGVPGYALRRFSVVHTALSKPEVERGWPTCKIVSNRGVTTLLLG